MPDCAEEIFVTGLVQGVGFRPFVWRLAQRLGVRGYVSNRGDGVRIVAAAPADLLEALVAGLATPPPHARIASIRRCVAQDAGWQDFTIQASQPGTVQAGIVADLAVCPACVVEITDPKNRRYQYAFTNCTDCGPRFSIVTGIPYDRARTTMAAFAMCQTCGAEYANPQDRRFHAQPVACPACGPQLEFLPGVGDGARVEGNEALNQTVASLRAGQIVAIKGIGGFHLACLARSEQAVAVLRARKNRPTRPLAVMVRDMRMAEAYAHLCHAERKALEDVSAPVVLVRRKTGQSFASNVAPGMERVGLLLPYTPLHVLLLNQIDEPLVMSSANRSGQPQVVDNVAALAELQGIADAWLMHDRPIARRLDDSVVRVLAGHTGVLRRGRGLAPEPLQLPAVLAKSPPVLGVGGDLKAAFCLTQRGRALLSHHLGDMAQLATEQAMLAGLADYRALFGQTPAIVAVDAHPAYRSRAVGKKLAGDHGWLLETVWHHHAHIAATMAENGWEQGPVLGLALDGTGYGPDGALWGCEMLVCDYAHMTRMGHLSMVPMPGGEKAVREPWRMLLAHLDHALGADATNQAQGVLRALQAKPVDTMRAMVRTGVNAPMTSSAGRLFDAMAALVGCAPPKLSYEGEAAMRLEALAEQAEGALAPLAFDLRMAGGLLEMDPTPMWRAALHRLQGGSTGPELAYAFHAGLARALATAMRQLAERTGLGTVALSGGVMHNGVLVGMLLPLLQEAGLKVLMPSHAPAGDGGLALGQAAVAAYRHRPV
ncbi:carbamoyltransferase HypF [Acetobacter sp. LMG 32666]|uniref:carbamoyltransferase HypF n=1 Tax=Acetobacter sp. LMG 32666 TaxID=2959295 RepID=UPI0030C8B76A